MIIGNKQTVQQCIIILMTTAGLFANVLSVKLKNGISYEGELSFENSFVCIITAGNMSSTIQKADIAVVNGNVYVAGSELNKYNSSAVQVQEVVPAKASVDTAAIDYKGKKLSIILKNGMLFNGTVISDKGKMLLLSRDGAPVNLYKSTIARIEIEGEPSGAAKTGEQSEAKVELVSKTDQQPADVPLVKKTAVQISSFDQEMEQPYTPSIEASRAKPYLETEKKQEIIRTEIKTDTISSADITAAVPDKQLSSIPEPLPVKETRVNQIVMTPLPAPLEKAAQPVHIPDNVFIPSAMPLNDGRRSILLKNGTVFKGKVLSENDRFIVIDSDGTSLNILKKVIKSIDGQAYKQTTAVAPASLPQVTEKQKLSVKKEKFSGRRPRPAVSVNENITAEMVIDSLKRSSWECRSRACRMLGTMGDWAYSAVPALGSLLADTAQSRTTVPVWIDTSDVRRLLAPSLEAARALAYLGDNGYRTLANGLNSSDAIVRRSAVFGLLEFPEDNSKTEMIFKMLRDKDGSVRAVALGAFCNLSGERLLIDALRDDETAVRCNAALLLGKMRSERAVPDLEKLFNDNRSIVRAHAVEAIGAIGMVNSSAKILSLLEDPNFNVRENAVEALGYLGDTIAIVPLINALRDVNPDVRGAAATSLSYIRDPRAIPSLYALLKDDNTTVREKARSSLRLHTELKQLIDGLNDQSATVRENASYVLWLLTGKDFGNDPEKWKQWYEQQGKKRAQ
ncbi:MAG TPA: HEAT repeat domain-containing protein [Chitinispirillaceae bacterium]|nr:HEAT repeat domain-containing protein [Chitinispirillaceae bacterium]